jgi:hypothetical protein
VHSLCWQSSLPPSPNFVPPDVSLSSLPPQALLTGPKTEPCAVRCACCSQPSVPKTFSQAPRLNPVLCGAPAALHPPSQKPAHRPQDRDNGNHCRHSSVRPLCAAARQRVSHPRGAGFPHRQLHLWQALHLHPTRSHGAPARSVGRLHFSWPSLYDRWVLSQPDALGFSIRGIASGCCLLSCITSGMCRALCCVSWQHLGNCAWGLPGFAHPTWLVVAV